MQIKEAVDYGAVEMFLNGVGSISEVAPGVFRVSFYQERDSNCGSLERNVGIHTLWTLGQLTDMLLHVQFALKEWPSSARASSAARAAH